MFEKVLIANRGEIALRVARACRELGMKSVAVYSTADAESAVVKFADEAVHIGPPAPARSYHHIPSIIGAALKTGADAIHPGYGFLSEDPYFAEICADEGITFIGPRPDVMEKVGDKATARELMQKAGLPLLPGTVEPVEHARRGARDRRRDRLPGDHQGRRGRRRARHERRDARATTSRGSTRRPVRRHRPSSRTAPSTSSATSRRRGTPRSSSSATRTETASTSASATARCSGATRS